MRLAEGVEIHDEAVEAFCARNGIARLALYGSALRGDLQPESDIDLLVEFLPGRTPGLLGIAAMELELSRLVGREVDLRTSGDLSRHFRDEVARTARVLHEAT